MFYSSRLLERVEDLASKVITRSKETYRSPPFDHFRFKITHGRRKVVFRGYNEKEFFQKGATGEILFYQLKTNRK